MNCKPGDLARVVRASIPQNLDRFVVVGEFAFMHAKFGPVWWVEPCGEMRSGCVLRTGQLLIGGTSVNQCPDAWLRPIRDPGDSAEDESVRWLPPVPTKEHA